MTDELKGPRISRSSHGFPAAPIAPTGSIATRIARLEARYVPTNYDVEGLRALTWAIALTRGIDSKPDVLGVELDCRNIFRNIGETSSAFAARVQHRHHLLLSELKAPPSLAEFYRLIPRPFI